MVVENGFNSDVIVQGQTYHVQTEDWGGETRLVVTKVFRDGAVVKSTKTSYSEILRSSHGDFVQALRLGMREQHQRILDLLQADRL
jgi:hypothetical protein